MSLSVLAVDDSRTIRDMLQLALEGAGFTATTAGDGHSALRVLAGMAQRPDAILTDINMPRMDGFGFIEALRRRPEYRAIPVIVLSTESADDLKARARAAGATGWIVKPFEPGRLVRALTMVAGTGAG